jgi:hypothetical protein
MTKTNTIIRRFYTDRSPVPLRIFHHKENNKVFNSYLTTLKKYKFYSFEWQVDGFDSSLFYSLDTTDIDFFSILEDIEIQNLKTNPEYFWVFDYSMEALFQDFWFKCITESAVKHEIPFNKIFFVSSNLLEQECYNRWREDNKVTNEFNILSFDYWSTVLMDEDFNNYCTIDQTVNSLRTNENKYFLSLNRRCRDFRVWTTMLLQQSSIFQKGLISGDIPSDMTQLRSKFEWQKLSNEEIDETKFKNYIDSLPWILDRKDFEVNWAWTNPSELFKQTFFSAVSETLHDDEGGRILFFSEKSFKPMLHNHPIFIFGQPGANNSLQKIGYKTYDKYFNFNFDLIQNPVNRLKAQIVQLESTCHMLDKLNIESKIEWFMQDQETLIYNKNQLFEQSYNKTKLEEFITRIEQ